MKNILINILIKININILLLYFIQNIKNKSTLSNKIPKVSVFLPIYNKGIYLKRSINSIQNQSLKDLEIIAVNDFSTDNTLKILKKLNKKDKRIIIINNDRNHGLLYSRTMGILNSSGEYVMNLDPDDLFTDEDNLKLLYYKSKELKVDMIIFLLKKLKQKKIIYLNKYLKELKQINNNSIKVKKKDYPIITNKFMKKSIILKSYQIFKTKIYGNKWNYHEDNIWDLLINKYAKSKLYINKYMYLYIKDNESLMNNRKNLLELKNLIYRYEMIKKLLKKNNLYELKKLLNKVNNNFKNIINKDIEIKKKLIHLIYNYLIYIKK